MYRTDYQGRRGVRLQDERGGRENRVPCLFNKSCSGTRSTLYSAVCHV